jgi:diguanylate cyclase (GGDEF)-like protein
MPKPTDNSQDARPRILIIDDSRLVRVSLSNVLSEEFEIAEAEDGEAGWEALLADQQIQVVLTDAGMPRLDGYELIERIRAHGESRIQQIPIIMITAADDEESRQRALGIGATDFITKPFDKTQLLARVRAQATLDQTARNLAETSEALVEQATDDHLTGVQSRRYFLKRGEQDLAFATRHERELAVMVIAIDGFEEAQQSQSEDVVRQMLTAVAGTLKASVRTEDTLARTGDARFAIIAPTLGRAEAEVMCERIRQNIASTPFVSEGTEINLSASLGLVNHGVDAADNIEACLAQAEQYAEQARKAGGNRLMAMAKAASKKRVSIDAAIRILTQGDPDKLLPHLDNIASQIVPLLEFCNQKQQWGVEEALAAIKQKMAG